MVKKTQKVALMVKVYHEEFFLPYMLEYYDTLGVDGIFIFDDGSTDTTHSLLSEWENDDNHFVIYQICFTIRYAYFSFILLMLSVIMNKLLYRFNLDRF